MLRLILILAFVGNSLSARAQDFATIFSEFLSAKRVLSSEVIAASRNYQYVFVSGFLSEQTPLYWSDNEDSLTELGIPHDRITILHPSSAQTTLQNSVWLAEQLLNITSQQPIILLAHSKGAVETVLFAAHNIEFVKRRIKAIFLIQGAFGGSAIADALYAKDLSLDSRMPSLLRITLKLDYYIRLFLMRNFMDGLKSLTTDYAKQLWSQQDERIRRLKGVLDNKLFFITSSQAPERMSHFLKSSGYYLSIYFGGENDGLLFPEDQSLALVGKKIAHLNADHADLTVSSPVSRRKGGYRFAFVQSLLTWLLD